MYIASVDIKILLVNKTDDYKWYLYMRNVPVKYNDYGSLGAALSRMQEILMQLITNVRFADSY
jgi:hypothetical protein